MSAKWKYPVYWRTQPVITGMYCTPLVPFPRNFKTPLHLNMQRLIMYQWQKWELLVPFGSWEHWRAARRDRRPKKASKGSWCSQFTERNIWERMSRWILSEVERGHKTVASISPGWFLVPLRSVLQAFGRELSQCQMWGCVTLGWQNLLPAKQPSTGAGAGRMCF